MRSNKQAADRKCSGCGETKPKREMIRVVRSPEGEITIDPTLNGKTPGRGAYICRSAECFEKAQKQKGLQRAFKGAVPDEVYRELAEAVKRFNDDIS